MIVTSLLQRTVYELSGQYHQESEDSHWTPFLNASINYIRNHYQRPWNEVRDNCRGMEINVNCGTPVFALKFETFLLNYSVLRHQRL